MTAAAGLPEDAIVTRRHADGGTESEALFSSCQRYRYSLTRAWDRAGPQVAFVMLNPSTADERADDPTVARCVRRARDGGFGSVCVANLFAFRETSPKRLRATPAPIGPLNDAAIATVCAEAEAVVAAWGVHGAHRGRGEAVARLIRQEAGTLLHLGLTQRGHPRHPLYVPYAVRPIPWHTEAR